MEFNSYVNRLLMKNPASRSRGLNIRTYTVVPLNEECGLIEWIPNLSGMRGILNRIYRVTGQYTSPSEFQHLIKKEDPLETKRKKFLDTLIKKHPPVFHLWFLSTFPDAQVC